VFGGRLIHWSSDTSTGTEDIELSCYGSGTFEPNNNLFIQPSIEGDATEIVAYFQGRVNKIINPRVDRSTPGVVYFYSETDGQTVGNEIQGGYGTENLAIGYLGGASLGNVVQRADFLSIPGNGGTALALTNNSTDGINGSHAVGYPAGTSITNKVTKTSDYVYALHARGFEGKRSGDGAARVSLDFYNGSIFFGDGTAAPTAEIAQDAGSLLFTGSMLPTSDNLYQLGASSNRFTGVYAVDDTINTSDAREKQWRGPLNDAEMRVAKRLSKLIGIYQWKAAVAEKGEAARLHVGVTAQMVKEAFDDEGLDGLVYGFLCYDEWEAKSAVIDDDGNVIRPAVEAGNRYGVRYAELWGFVAAGFEARLAALEAGA
jgi:hypothetical protein